jgi:hypothetical protein
MIKNVFNKEMQPAERSSQESKERGNLYCIKECEIPGVGYFKPGDAVEEHEKYLLLKDHPFFSNQAPEAK